MTASPPVVASASIRGSVARAMINRPRSAPACSIAVRISMSSSLLQHDLARHGLRHLDHGREVQVFDRRPDRAGRPGRRLFLAQVRMQLIELPHLAVGAPAQIAVAGVAQISAGESSRSHAPHRSARRVRWRVPHCERTRWRGPNGWPVRRGARRRARGLRCGRSPRRPGRRGSRNSPDNSPPRSASCPWWAARASRCDAAGRGPGMQDAARESAP